MSFKSILKLDSPIISAEKRKAAGGHAARNAARKFKNDLQQKMETGQHTGKTVTKARGGGFSVRHQQSKRGERPAPFTRTLKNSIRDKRVSETESVVKVEAEYAERLIKLGRVIVSAKDRRDGQKDLDQEKTKEFAKLL